MRADFQLPGSTLGDLNLSHPSGSSCPSPGTKQGYRRSSRTKRAMRLVHDRKKAIRFLFSLSWDASMTARGWPVDRTQAEPPLPSQPSRSSWEEREKCEE